MIMLSETDFTEEKLFRFVEVRQIFYKDKCDHVWSDLIGYDHGRKIYMFILSQTPCVLALPLLSA